MGRRLDAGDTSVRLLPGAMTEAQGFLADHPKTRERYEREVAAASSQPRRDHRKPSLPAPSTGLNAAGHRDFGPPVGPPAEKVPRKAIPDHHRKPLICRDL